MSITESMLDGIAAPGSLQDTAVSSPGKEHTLYNYRFKLFFGALRFVRHPGPHRFWLLFIMVPPELICLLLNWEQKSHLLTSYNLSDVQVRREEIKEQVTEEDLDKRVDIYLTETETLCMLDLPPVVVSVESEDAARVLYVYLQLHTCILNAQQTELLLTTGTQQAARRWVWCSGCSSLPLICVWSHTGLYGNGWHTAGGLRSGIIPVYCQDIKT